MKATFLTDQAIASASLALAVCSPSPQIGLEAITQNMRSLASVAESVPQAEPQLSCDAEAARKETEFLALLEDEKQRFEGEVVTPLRERFSFEKLAVIQDSPHPGEVDHLLSSLLPRAPAKNRNPNCMGLTDSYQLGSFEVCRSAGSSLMILQDNKGDMFFGLAGYFHYWEGEPQKGSEFVVNVMPSSSDRFEKLNAWLAANTQAELRIPRQFPRSKEAEEIAKNAKVAISHFDYHFSPPVNKSRIDVSISVSWNRENGENPGLVRELGREMSVSAFVRRFLLPMACSQSGAKR